MSRFPTTDDSVLRQAPQPKSEVTGEGVPMPRAGVPSDFLIWQLADSAFPTGGFVHSGGLEAARQLGEVRDRADLSAYLEASLHQQGHGALPFVQAAHREPGQLADLDAACDAFTLNHVANRASRLQGRALLRSSDRIFDPGAGDLFRAALERAGEAFCSHLAPAFGAVARGLGLERLTTARLFLHLHMRSLTSAAVRLGMVGPVEAQTLQRRLAPQAETLLRQCADLGVEDATQTAPLLELLQCAHDQLYSRLFQS
jgi:urease accessory protein